MVRHKLLYRIVAYITLFSILGVLAVSADTLYPWEVYQDTMLDKAIEVSSNGQVDIGNTQLYSSMINDVNDNTDKPIQQYRFTVYLQLVSGSASVTNANLRFSTNAVMYANPVPTVTLSSDTVIPLSFVVPSQAALQGTPVLRLYISTGGCVFRVTGISCTAYRLVEKPDTQLVELQSIKRLFILCIAILLSVWIFKAFKSVLNNSMAY